MLIQAIPTQAQKLLHIKGISYIRAIEIIVELKGKIPKEKQLANYAGIAPVEISSGASSRFINNKFGNRRLNSIFYSITLSQVKFNPDAKKYYLKKLSEGKSPRHARKCIARYLVKLICKTLNN